MTEGELNTRTENLALVLIRFVEALPIIETCRVLGRQLLRLGTSVAACYRAACRARSDADFVNKLGIVEEEADESLPWLRLLERSGHAQTVAVEVLYLEMEAVLKMFVASIKTERLRGNSKFAV